MILMGVSGAGKSTLGSALAARLHWPMIDCDDLHPAANIEKMRHGQPLNEADRAPWLDLIAARLAALAQARISAVVACSALKRAYRTKIVANCDDALLFYLKAERRDIERRMQERRGHFMPFVLLDSQFSALEEPAPDERIVELDAHAPLEDNLNLLIAACEVRKRD